MTNFNSPKPRFRLSSTSLHNKNTSATVESHRQLASQLLLTSGSTWIRTSTRVLQLSRVFRQYSDKLVIELGLLSWIDRPDVLITIPFKLVKAVKFSLLKNPAPRRDDNLTCAHSPCDISAEFRMNNSNMRVVQFLELRAN